MFDAPLCLRDRSDGKDGTDSVTREAVSEKEAPEEERVICCAECLKTITRPSERISVDGTHTHTFANPSGMVYEIGCFGSAVGCGTAGPSSDEFTWFKGYRWKVAFCGGCLLHLGWQFASGGGGFYGLILDRLIAPE